MTIQDVKDRDADMPRRARDLRKVFNKGMNKIYGKLEKRAIKILKENNYV